LFGADGRADNRRKPDQSRAIALRYVCAAPCQGLAVRPNLHRHPNGRQCLAGAAPAGSVRWFALIGSNAPVANCTYTASVTPPRSERIRQDGSVMTCARTGT
jgi:hypothetical protein